jgi:hypothetical protein
VGLSWEMDSAWAKIGSDRRRTASRRSVAREGTGKLYRSGVRRLRKAAFEESNSRYGNCDMVNGLARRCHLDGTQKVGLSSEGIDVISALGPNCWHHAVCIQSLNNVSADLLILVI